MSIITDLTRMWLTRSAKPFLFQNEYDQQLPFSQCEGLGLYVHIPFCRELCGFCPYCKVQYDRAACDRYLDRLIREIHLVGGQLPGRKRVTSLYFGGGTPALAAGRLKEVMEAIEAHFIITEGVGVELHPEDVVPSVLRILRDVGVTRISIGVQSFQRKFQGLLGRRPVDLPALREALSQVHFETVSMDFIFALPGQDLDCLLYTSSSSPVPSRTSTVVEASPRMKTAALSSMLPTPSRFSRWREKTRRGASPLTGAEGVSPRQDASAPQARRRDRTREAVRRAEPEREEGSGSGRARMADTSFLIF